MPLALRLVPSIALATVDVRPVIIALITLPGNKLASTQRTNAMLRTDSIRDVGLDGKFAGRLVLNQAKPPCADTIQ